MCTQSLSYDQTPQRPLDSPSQPGTRPGAEIDLTQASVMRGFVKVIIHLYLFGCGAGHGCKLRRRLARTVLAMASRWQLSARPSTVPVLLTPLATGGCSLTCSKGLTKRTGELAAAYD